MLDNLQNKIGIAASILLLSALSSMVNVAYGEGSVTATEKEHPVLVNLSKIGWKPPKNQSNKVFFKNLSTSKLQALDQNTRLFFLTEDILVIHHVITEGPDWHAATRTLEAFFVNAKTGSLIRIEHWPALPRKSADELRDSEGRLFPLHDGKLLVVNNKQLAEYSPNLELSQNKLLEQGGRNDLWAVQTVDEGRQIFLRHESPETKHIQFMWLDSNTLEIRQELPDYPFRYLYNGFPMQGAVVASSNAVFGGSRMITDKGQFKTVCVSDICQKPEHIQVVGGEHLVITSKVGMALINIHDDSVSSKLVENKYLKNLQFGWIRSSQDSTRFGVWITASRSSIFDGTTIPPWTPSVSILIYDVADANRKPLQFNIKPVDGQWDFAISPSGASLGVFDGATVRVYSL